MLMQLPDAGLYLCEARASSHLGGPEPPFWKMPANLSGSKCCLTTSCTHARPAQRERCICCMTSRGLGCGHRVC